MSGQPETTEPPSVLPSAGDRLQHLVTGMALTPDLVELIHPDDRAGFEALRCWAAQGAGRELTLRVRLERGPGRWTTVFVTLSGAADGQARMTLELGEEAADRQTAAELHAVIHGAPEAALVTIGPETVYFNTAFARLLGFDSVAEFQASGQRRFIHPEDRPRVRARLLVQPGEEAPLQSGVFRMIRRDGCIILVESFASPIVWEGRKARLAWLSDVTLRERTAQELRSSTEAAERANRSKSEFLANMSHELRTPLNAIIGFSEVIKNQLFGPVGTLKYAQYAGDIYESGTHLLQIINDILDLSKLEAGRLELHESVVSLPALIKGCIPLVRDRAAASGIRIRLVMAEALPPLLVDERMMKQILINLLSNAVKFTGRGGRIAISAALAETGGLEISVADTGIGMSAGDIEVALQTFGQVDNSTTRAHQGTGLGLPLARSLAELHGGSLRVDSAIGTGTAITVTLPPTRVLKDRVFS